MNSINEIIESTPVPCFYLNNQKIVRHGHSREIKELVHKIAKKAVGLPKEYELEHENNGKYYEHFVQMGNCPNGKIEYFMLTIDRNDKEIKDMIEEYFGKQINKPLHKEHLNGIRIKIRYIKKLKSGSVEYAGFGSFSESDKGRSQHFILAYIPKTK